MATKSNSATKQSKKPTTDCHCGETKGAAKTKEKKSTKTRDCSDCK
ncbi:MAG: hypothetical protein NC037_01990 [Bacteroides sp.]|nr:hypothetical protein [Bacillota bacterium]MCM1393480.1 hypothetical protein [[Eubacterium] siraeum]MCM1455286.1 hypothetical protein [Bacteroides sp.]